MTADEPADRALRSTFDQAAARYHRARPRYPEGLIDEVCQAIGPASGAHVLEVGPATGVATEQMARRGFRITAVELGTELAEVARAVLEPFPEVEVVTASFDDWEPMQWSVHDAVVVATAWHWLDPATKYERAHAHLRPGGVLAFWASSHVFPEGGDEFFREMQEVYEEIEQSTSTLTWPRPGELPDRRDEIESSGLFDVVSVSHHDWEVSYDAESYIDLLETFSGHIAMAPRHKTRLHDEIRRRLGQRATQRCVRGWGAVLHIARAR